MAAARAQSIGDLLPLAVPGFAVAAGVTAQSRLHPENTAQGMVFGFAPGDLVAYPALGARVGVDSAPGAGRGASAVTAVQPSVRIEDAALGLVGYAGADLTRYAGDPGANANDITAGLGAAVPFGADTVTLGAARIASRQTALGLAQTGGAAPFGVVVDAGRIADRHEFGAFDATLRLGVSHTGLTRNAGAPLAFRSKTLLRGSSTLDTAQDGVMRWLVLLKASAARYRGALPDSGFSNATALAAAGGFETERSAIVRLRLVAGMVRQSFAPATKSGGMTPIVSAGLVWNPDGLMSLDAEFTRQAGLDTALGTPGTAVNTATLALAEDYAPDLQFSGNIDARTGTVGGHPAREIDASMGAVFHFSRAVAFEPTLSYALRHNLPGSAPHEVRALIGVVWAP